MSYIRFYVPNDETIPTDLRLYVGDVYVRYERIEGGFRFDISLDDENEAMKVANEIVQAIMLEHDESEHGVSWQTTSFKVVPQEERYKSGTIVEWKYRVRDSF